MRGRGPARHLQGERLRLLPGDGDPGNLTRDHILDNVTLHWLTGTGASAARSYWEDALARAQILASGQTPPDVSIPVGFTTFPSELWRTPRSWVENSYANVTYFNEVDKGGHFAAWEEPELFAAELRAAFNDALVFGPSARPFIGTRLANGVATTMRPALRNARTGRIPSSTQRPSAASRPPWTTPASPTTNGCARPWSTGSPLQTESSTTPTNNPSDHIYASPPNGLEPETLRMRLVDNWLTEPRRNATKPDASGWRSWPTEPGYLQGENGP
jgi:hypothetical protein